MGILVREVFMRILLWQHHATSWGSQNKLKKRESRQLSTGIHLHFLTMETQNPLGRAPVEPCSSLPHNGMGCTLSCHPKYILFSLRRLCQTLYHDRKVNYILKIFKTLLFSFPKLAPAQGYLALLPPHFLQTEQHCKDPPEKGLLSCPG